MLTNWHYWLLFAVVALLWLAIPLVARWERKQDERDAELWAERFGGDIYSRKVPDEPDDGPDYNFRLRTLR